jgi:methylated-DNA-[protein]-cysteine S-methyltransferase
MTYYTFLDSPAGTLLLMSDGNHITGIHWKVFKRTPKVQKDWIENKKIFSSAIKQLDEYFKGKRTSFNLDMEIKGTEFQKKVWKQLQKIPYGKSITYGSIAKAINHPKAVRAVGTAVGSNPICIIIPCHRVLAAQNKLGGYAGGLKSKQTLLARENISWK